MRLHELFNSVYPFKLAEKSKTRVEFRFKTVSGVQYSVYFSVVPMRPYGIDASGVELTFGLTGSHDLDMTGTGDSFKVGSTVAAICNSVISQLQPEYITFSGKTTDAGRIKLYDRISNSPGRWFPGYRLLKVDVSGDTKDYVLVSIT